MFGVLFGFLDVSIIWELVGREYVQNVSTDIFCIFRIKHFQFREVYIFHVLLFMFLFHLVFIYFLPGNILPVNLLMSGIISNALNM